MASMTPLALALSHAAETPLSDVIHAFDRYEVELELADTGKRVCWDALMDCRTVGDLVELVG